MATATTKTATPPPTLPSSPSWEENKKSIVEVLSYPISLSSQISVAAIDAKSSKWECDEVEKMTENIGQMLCSVTRIAAATSPGALYERPIRRIVADVSRKFEEALTLVRKCGRRRRVMSIVSDTGFRKLLLLLDNSVADMKWLLNILDGGGGIMSSLPPIAFNDPIFSWIWTCIASLYMCQITDEVEAANRYKVEAANRYKVEAANRDKVAAANRDKVAAAKRDRVAAANRDKVEADNLYKVRASNQDIIDAANQLALLAQDNDRNKKIIIEEGGVPPLFKLLNDSFPVDVQIASVTTLLYLANDEEMVCSIIDELGDFIIVVEVLGNSPAEVQIKLANLVGRMAELSLFAKETFMGENVINSLVTLLSRDVFADELNFKIGKHSSHSTVQINEELERNHLHNRGFGSSCSMHNVNDDSKRGHNKRKKEKEDPELKLRLKISCAEALWMLARGSVLNSKRITETKGLLCLAKLVEKGQGELLVKCLMAIMEITAAAESNSDLRKAAFRTNSLAAKAVVDQLLNVIKDKDYDDPIFLIPAIKSIGFLARTFTAKETRVIAPLVEKLDHWDEDVAVEAAIALEKFASPENFLCLGHSETIIDLKVLEPLRRLLRGTEQKKLHGLIILCYLLLHAGNSGAQERELLLETLRKAGDALLERHPELQSLILKVVFHLKLYHNDLYYLQLYFLYSKIR